ncbi:carboxypeptidase-like regulatory domain-containing protein [Gaetbulibacter saemankumensis]|uniref:carboxypeptidase-like regulatory domain-containing protein n=1 Tax=Gaetbulibacter saemankumensis TaxID=311208 RepID=UPI0004013EA6|nr:carboxypeptidase-like regulatory domain-containing protein [Gaetbulibacter saemankumensis]
MKVFFFIASLFISSTLFAQNTGMVVGKIMDNELTDAPLVLAKVSVKGTDIEASTDLSGLFYIENLQDGEYTLICSFIGYESKEIHVKVNAFEPTELKIGLAASTISLNDIASLTNLAQKEEDPNTVLN